MKIYISGYDCIGYNSCKLKLDGHTIVNKLENAEAVYMTRYWQDVEYYGDKAIKDHAYAGVLGKVIMFEVGEE